MEGKGEGTRGENSGWQWERGVRGGETKDRRREREKGCLASS